MQYIFLVAAIIYVAYAAVDSDEVTNLPGLTFKPTFKHYSGYLQATGTKKLHYWFDLFTYNYVYHIFIGCVF